MQSCGLLFTARRVYCTLLYVLYANSRISFLVILLTAFPLLGWDGAFGFGFRLLLPKLTLAESCSCLSLFLRIVRPFCPSLSLAKIPPRTIQTASSVYVCVRCVPYYSQPDKTIENFCITSSTSSTILKLLKCCQFITVKNWWHFSAIYIKVIEIWSWYNLCFVRLGQGRKRAAEFATRACFCDSRRAAKWAFFLPRKKHRR